MNTTYDTKFRFRSMVDGMDNTLYQWQKSQPTLHTIANAVKSWQKDWDTLGSILNRESASAAAKTHNIHMALEEAWENRDNRALAVKSLGGARELLKSFFDNREEEQSSFVPLYRRRSMKSAFGYEEADVQVKPFNQYDSVMRVKAWTEQAREHLNELQNVPQNNRQYIAYNPNLEGSIYQRTAMRVKAWIEDEYLNIHTELKPESKYAVKAVLDTIEHIQASTPDGLLDQAQRRRIHTDIRNAFKALDNIEPEVRTPVIKSDIFGDVDSLRKRIDNVMPVLESGKYHDTDLYREVTQTIDAARNLAEAAPIKFMPPDTWENFQNLDRSLSQVLINRNPSVKVKSLRAAAANLDVIARDMAGLESFLLNPAEVNAYKADFNYAGQGNYIAYRGYKAGVYAKNPFLA